jgi:membrane associated rhomboid family serine protease
MPNPRGRPVANYLLIGVNIAVYLLITLPLGRTPANPNDPALLEYIRTIPQYWNVPVAQLLRHVSAYDLFVFTHGFKPAHPSVLDLFSSMFMHAGLLHLAGNMLFLWIYGDNVEHRLGSLNYLFVYLATGMAATLFYTLFQLHSAVPMIGASGAISGVLGLYFIWFPRNKVRVFVMLFPFFVDVILLPARWVLGFFLIVDNLLPFFLASGRGGGVAHGAHIGGFLAGLGIAYAMDRFPEYTALSRWRSAWSTPSSQDREKEEERPLHDRIREAVDGRDLHRAAADYLADTSVTARKKIEPLDRLRIGNYLLGKSHYSEALSIFRQYIADFHDGPALDQAYLGAGIALYEGKGQLTAAYQYFLGVLDVSPSKETESQARRYLQAIYAMQKMQMRR